MKKLLPTLVLLIVANYASSWNGTMKFTKDGSDGFALLSSDSKTVCIKTVGTVEIVSNYFMTNSEMCAGTISINDLFLTPTQTVDEAVSAMEDNDFERVN